MSAAGAAVRLSLTTFTALRSPRPTTVPRRVAAGALLLGPLIGVGLGLVAAAALLLFRVHDEPLLGGGLALAVVAVLSGGRNLTGLADTFEDMFAHGGRATWVGVCTVVPVLTVQVFALAIAGVHGHGTQAILTACAVGRLGAAWACLQGTPARPGDLVADPLVGSMSWGPALAATALVTLATAFYGGVIDDDASPHLAVLGVGAVLFGLLATAFVRTLCRRRLGGIDRAALGAVIEIATMATLVTLAF